MKTVKVNIEWASDGTVGAIMQEDLFAGHGDSVEAAVEDMRNGVALFVETAKEQGFPYKPFLADAYEVELEYDIESILKYARNYMSEIGIAKLTGISPAQLNRYTNGKDKPRPTQARKILESLQRFGAAFSAISL
ncbi:MAG: helix-turn-helix domain-containing protein [Alistipes sp.]|nr:helix-turn-helix domain-containing protein [Alistipes sp.]